jgi:hypothetical protein
MHIMTRFGLCLAHGPLTPRRTTRHRSRVSSLRGCVGVECEPFLAVGVSDTPTPSPSTLWGRAPLTSHCVFVEGMPSYWMRHVPRRHRLRHRRCLTSIPRRTTSLTPLTPISLACHMSVNWSPPCSHRPSFVSVLLTSSPLDATPHDTSDPTHLDTLRLLFPACSLGCSPIVSFADVQKPTSSSMS